MESTTIYQDLTKAVSQKEITEIIVERDSNKTYKFPPKTAINIKMKEINKRSNLKDSLTRFDSNSTAASTESKEALDSRCKSSALPDLTLKSKSVSYQSYLTEKNITQPKKAKRSYYWKINELAILYMVKIFY